MRSIAFVLIVVLTVAISAPAVALDAERTQAPATLQVDGAAWFTGFFTWIQSLVESLAPAFDTNPEPPTPMAFDKSGGGEDPVTDNTCEAGGYTLPNGC